MNVNVNVKDNANLGAGSLPMIRGHGIDLVSVARVQRMVSEHGVRFLAKTFSPDELATVLGAADAEIVAEISNGHKVYQGHQGQEHQEHQGHQEHHGQEHHKLVLPPVSARCVRRLASRFAAKEATFKAIGTGMSTGMSWHDAAVISLQSGQPVLVVSGGAAVFAAKLGIQRWHISLTDTDEWAMASVIGEG